MQKEIEETATRPYALLICMCPVDVLKAASACLAGLPDNGTSPLFLAISPVRHCSGPCTCTPGRGATSSLSPAPWDKMCCMPPFFTAKAEVFNICSNIIFTVTVRLLPMVLLFSINEVSHKQF